MAIPRECAARLAILLPLLFHPCADAIALAPAITSGSSGPGNHLASPFSEASSAADWASPWAYRVGITVSPDSLPESEELLGFPLLLRLDAFNALGVFLHAKPDGSDIAVMGHDGTTSMDREVVSYDNLGRKAEIWVRADTLSRRSNTLYLYYGHPDTTIAPADSSVWTRYLAVYHFSEDPSGGILLDHGPYRNDAAAMGGWSVADTANTIGRAWRFNGTSQWLNADGMTCLDTTYTISAWFGVDHQSTIRSCFAFQSEEGYWHLSALRNTTSPYADILTSHSNVGWNPILPDTMPHLFVWSMDGVADTVRFFFDGAEESERFRWVPNQDKAYTGERIGRNVGIAGPCGPSLPDLFDGTADEFRIFLGIRSPAWLRIEHINQGNAPGFLSYSTEEPTAVLLTGLEATTQDMRVVLKWDPLPGAFSAFYVERKDAVSGDEYVRLNGSAPVPSHGPWVFADSLVEAGGAYMYRIAAISISGETLLFGPVSVSVSFPEGPTLGLDGPNPGMTRGTKIVVRLPHSGKTALILSDCSGRCVRRLLNQELPSGIHSYEWDGLDATGSPVPSGVYVAALSWKGRIAATKVVLIR